MQIRAYRIHRLQSASCILIVSSWSAPCDMTDEPRGKSSGQRKPRANLYAAQACVRCRTRKQVGDRNSRKPLAGRRHKSTNYKLMFSQRCITEPGEEKVSREEIHDMKPH